MPKTIVNQTSFAAGEISPSLFGRTDREIYANGAARLRNVYVAPLGGLLRRPGTKYIAGTTGNAKGRLLTFQFNIDQVYAMVFTPQEVKIYRNDALQATVTTGLTGLTADIIDTMDYVQSLDTLILIHPDIQPIKIVRTNDTTWNASNLSLSNIPSFDFGAVTVTGTITPSAVSGAITLTASSSVFTAGMVGYTVLLNDGRAVISAFTSGTEVSADVVGANLSGTGAESEWVIEEPVWSSTRGWPRSGTFYQQRLYFGGSKSRPNTVWGSKLSGFFDFDLATGADADAIEFTIDDDQVNAIEGIFGGRTLQIFSQSAEYFAPLIADQTLTPGNIKLERATRHGSSRIKPISSDGATIFVEQSGQVVREYVFLDVEQSYISDDISYVSEHLINSPKRIALQKSQTNLPGEYSYFVNDNGTIAVLNRRRSQSFIAWSLWETEGLYEDVAVVGNDVYVLVKRTINSATVRYLEKFSYDYYTDAGILLTDTETTSWSGLGHLEAATVSVRSGDGYPLLENVVDTGAITTESAQTDIEVGLPWGPTVRSLPPVNPRTGIIGERVRLVRANLNLKDSNSFVVTTNSGGQTRVALTSFGDITFNQSVPLFNGWKTVPLRGYSRQPYFEITQDKPVDFGLLSMTLEVTV